MALSPNYNWSEPDNSSLVKDGALAMRTLGNAIDTSLWNSGYGQAGKNKIINGSMAIAQRGTSIAFTGSGYQYMLDRWLFVRGSFATGATVSQQTTSDTTNLPFIQYCSRVQRDNGNTSTQYLEYSQTVETANAIVLAGQTVVVSFYARKGANYSSSNSFLGITLATGTGTNQSQQSFTNRATPIATDVTLTTTWQRFSKTITLGNTITEYGVIFSYTPVGTAGAADYFEVTGVQLEYGSLATPFQTASGGSIQGELAMCQRYYEVINGAALFGLAVNTTTIQVNGTYKVQKRIDPTLTGLESALDILNAGNGYKTSAASTYTFNANTAQGVYAVSAQINGFTLLIASTFVTVNETNNVISASAEL